MKFFVRIPWSGRDRSKLWWLTFDVGIRASYAAGTCRVWGLCIGSMTV